MHEFRSKILSDLKKMTIRQKIKLLPPLFLRYSIVIFALFFFIGFGFVFMGRIESGELHQCFVRAAQRLQEGQPLYRFEDQAYVYPPFMAMISIPMAHLPSNAALFIWYLIHVGAALIVFGCAWKLAGGPAISHLNRTWKIIFVLMLILAGRYYLEAFKNQGFDMVIAAFVLFGCYQLWRGHDFRAGVSLAVATAMKCTPLLFAPFLIWRGKPKVAGILIMTALAVNFLPDLFWPQVNGHSYMTDWYAFFLRKAVSWTPGQWAPSQWFNSLLFNQSLAGLFNRFMKFGFPFSIAQLTHTSPVEFSVFQSYILRVLVYGSEGLLLILTAWCFGKPWTRILGVDTFSCEPMPLEKLQIGIESSVILCLMLLLSPMSDKSHYGVMILPSIFLSRLFMEHRVFWMNVLMGVLLISSLSAKDIVGKGLGNLMLAWGIPTWFVLFSMLGLFLGLRQIHCKATVENSGISNCKKSR